MSEVDFVVSKVSEHLRVLETVLLPDRLEIRVQSLSGDIHRDFDSLRRELVPLDYVPILRKEGGGWKVYVLKLGKRRFRGPWLNLVLFIATVLSTWYVGVGLYSSYFGAPRLDRAVLLGGLIYFSLPLMAVLTVHELSHYFAAKHYGVRASLPYFIPAPTIVGTLGAFISLRDPVPNRRALIVIGAAGPIGGFLATIPVAILGSYLNSTIPAAAPPPTGPVIVIGMPLITRILEKFFPVPGLIHPTYYAAWVSFIVTAMNLLPLGQLDGGHIARGLLGEASKYLSWGVFAFLIVLGILYFPGWIIFGILGLALGLRHPPPLDDYMPIEKKHVAVGVAAALLFSVTFVPAPVTMVVPSQQLQVEVPSAVLASPGNLSYVNVVVRNQGIFTFNGTPEVELRGINGTVSLEPEPPYSFPPGEEREFLVGIVPNMTGTGTLRISLLGVEEEIPVFSGVLTDEFGIYFDGSDFEVIELAPGAESAMATGRFEGPPGNYVLVAVPDFGLNVKVYVEGVPVNGTAQLALVGGEKISVELSPSGEPETDHLDVSLALYWNGTMHVSTVSLMLSR